jgi:hypothetical protein
MQSLELAGSNRLDGATGRGPRSAARIGRQWSANAFQFDAETWEAIEAVMHDAGKSFQQIADEARSLTTFSD